MNKGIQLGVGVESSNSNGSCKYSSFLKNTKKFMAFTLAETLIVMGVIGVVAALTIPNLNSSTNNMEKITKVKKIYAELNEAQERAIAVYGPIENWFMNDNCNSEDLACRQRYFDRIVEFMKVTKTCRDNNEGHCFNGAITDLNGADIYYESGYPSAILSNGISVYIRSLTQPSCHGFVDGYDDTCGQINVDIDGPSKGKTVNGIDIFWFAMSKEGIKYPYRSDWFKNYIYYCTYYGWYCTTWIMEYGNMDYLLTPDKSTIQKSKICPNSKELSGTVTSCK